MIEIINKAQCCGCHACMNACPKKCISMISDEEGFLYPIVNKGECIDCGLCEKVCPCSKTVSKRGAIPDTYAVMAKDNGIRFGSSSGGVFTLLAENTLSDDGVVYGVAMEKDLKSAKHIRVDSPKGLDLLRGSKYLQAATGDVYRRVRDDLDAGKKVLFSGVPCQINGLKFYLQKEYDNLLSVEVICHGTPSPALWKKYFEHLESKYNAKIEKINFREKRNGWKNYGVAIEGKGIDYFCSISDEPYMQMFLRNYCLRPSCFQCKAKECDSMADLTIADLWGSDSIVPEMDDDKGVSLVLLQSKKGQDTFERLKNAVVYQPISFSDSIKYNPSYYKSSRKSTKRKKFYVDMNTMSFDALTAKYCKPTKTNYFYKCARYAKRTIKKIIFHKK